MRMMRILVLASCALLVCHTLAHAQDKPKLVEIKIDKDLSIEDFLEQISKSTGKPLLRE